MKETYAQRAINIALHDEQCSVIGPQVEYDRDSQEFPPPTKPRKEGNMELLEKTISGVMIKNHQANLANILSEQIPISYIDCSRVGDNLIMVSIVKTLLTDFNQADKDEILKNALLEHSFVSDKENNLLEEFINGYQGDDFFNDLLAHHQKLLKEKYEEVETNNAWNGKKVFEREQHYMIEALEDIFEHYKREKIYLYLDNVATLPSEQQQQIMNLVFCRWNIGSSRRGFYIKINNGNKWWKSYYTSNGKRVEAPHDYGSRSIKENDLFT